MIYYGQKLQLNDLFDPKWIEKFTEPLKVAKALKQSGISFVELPIDEETETDTILDITRIFTNEGLFVSLHPYLYKELSPEIFNESKIPGLIEMLSTAQEISELTGFPVPYVFHGGRARAEPYFVDLGNAISHAKAFFSWVGDICSSQFSSIIPLCETQTPWDASDKEMVRLGDTYQSCLDLIQDTDMGICWDFGHTYRSTFLKKQQELPDDKFLARVQHVHAHDTIETGEGPEDHFPLGDGLVPWRKYCAELARYQYSDSILLEINPTHFKDLDDIIFFTKDGIERLKVFFDEEIGDSDELLG